MTDMQQGWVTDRGRRREADRNVLSGEVYVYPDVRCQGRPIRTTKKVAKTFEPLPDLQQGREG